MYCTHAQIEGDRRFGTLKIPLDENLLRIRSRVEILVRNRIKSRIRLRISPGRIRVWVRIMVRVRIKFRVTIFGLVNLRSSESCRNRKDYQIQHDNFGFGSHTNSFGWLANGLLKINDYVQRCTLLTSVFVHQ